MQDTPKTAPLSPAEEDQHAAVAVHTEVSTTKSPDRKAEIAKELVPPVKSKRQLRTRRVIH